MLNNEDNPIQILNDDYQRRAGPVENNAEVLLLNAQRYNNAAAAQQEWSVKATQCVDYFEGKQWSAADLSKLNEEGRPALTINKIAPLVNLVYGFHLTNQTQTGYEPATDGTGVAETAKILSHVRKQIHIRNGEQFVDAEVYLDGILGGRGFWDWRLDFENNQYGEARVQAQDPFSVYLDPNGLRYDLSDSNFVMTSKMVSNDEVEFTYGKWAADMLAPVFNSGGYTGMPGSIYDGYEEVTPWRTFGGEDSITANSWGVWGDMFWDWVDPYRKTARMLDIQHRVRTRAFFLEDLETGESKLIPDHWGRDKMQRVMALAAERGDPLTIRPKAYLRTRWTQIIGDIVVWDDWSPYSSFTIIPYFPYFRRGQTRGMVNDLIDPQNELNNARSERMNMIGRSSRGGYIVEKHTIDPQQKANLDMNGSSPGFVLEWDSNRNSLPAPKAIEPGTTPIAQKQLEEDSNVDLKEISGINDAALGQVSNVESGRAIEAKQRQSIIGIEGFQTNWVRSKRLGADKALEIVQNWYVEERIIRITGAADTPIEHIINQRAASGIVNNITVGNYEVTADEKPLSATFLAAVFEELLRLKELGVPVPDDLIIDASSLDDKMTVKGMIQQERAAEAEREAAGIEPKSVPHRIGARGQNLPPGEVGAPSATR